MASMLEVLCFDSAEHRSMFRLSVMLLFANIASNMTLVGFGTVRIAVNFLQNFHILFFRYTPAYFYWSSLSLARNVSSA